MRKEVQKDDIIDALCMAIIGMIGQDNGLTRIPNQLEIDAKGLEMQMVYSKMK